VDALGRVLMAVSAAADPDPVTAIAVVTRVLSGRFLVEGKGRAALAVGLGRIVPSWWEGFGLVRAMSAATDRDPVTAIAAETRLLGGRALGEGMGRTALASHRSRIIPTGRGADDFALGPRPGLPVASSGYSAFAGQASTVVVFVANLIYLAVRTLASATPSTDSRRLVDDLVASDRS